MMQRMISVLAAVCLTICLVFPMPGKAEETISAEAYVLMEAATGTVISERNADEKRPMASTTKIMSALLTMESGELDIPFTVDAQAIHVEGSSMGLQENDIVTKRALCYGMLLPSGNDAANAAAVAVSGSIPAFVEKMNARAAEIGMHNTQFVTPSGLDAQGHGASAYDMALLTRTALANETFCEICCRESALVTFGNPPYERTLYNSNKLLSMCEDVIGVKTGFTDAAGRCLVSAAQRDGITLICVTLNAPDDWQDHQKLYESGFSKVSAKELEVPPALFQNIVGSDKESITLQPEELVTIGVQEQNTGAIRCRVLLPPFSYAPIAAGDTVGTLEYYYEDCCIAAVPLCAAEDAAAMEVKQPSGNPFVRFWNWLCDVWK